MQLKWFHVPTFQSTRDSNRIDVGDISCLVGKNEAGKSALLKALYRLNPIVAEEGKFDVTQDFPRMEVEDYRHEVEAGRREVAVPIEAGFLLEKQELGEIEDLFGSQCLAKEPELRLSKNYEGKLTFGLFANPEKSLSYLVDNAGFADAIREALKGVPRTADDLLTTLKGQEQTEDVKEVTNILTAVKKRGVNGYIYDTILENKISKFLYFDEYYQITGHENIDALT
jgi:hypothetical protein